MRQKFSVIITQIELICTFFLNRFQVLRVVMPWWLVYAVTDVSKHHDRSEMVKIKALRSIETSVGV